MTHEEVLALLQAHRNERGVAAFERSGLPGRSYGLGLTGIKQLARGLAPDHALARALWRGDLFDGKLLSCSLGEPMEATWAEVNEDIEHARPAWMLSHAWCTGWLPRTPFVLDAVETWTGAEDWLRRRCGFLLLCPLAKVARGDDRWFLDWLEVIARDLQGEHDLVKDAMNNVMLYVGGRNVTSWRRAMEVARAVGSVQVDYGDNRCVAVDVAKHLDGPKYRERFGGS